MALRLKQQKGKNEVVQGVLQWYTKYFASRPSFLIHPELAAVRNRCQLLAGQHGEMELGAPAGQMSVMWEG